MSQASGSINSLQILRKLPFTVIDRIVHFLGSEALDILLLIWDRNHDDHVQNYIRFVCVPRFFPELIEHCHDAYLIKQSFYFDESLQLSLPQELFLRQIMQPPFNCVIAGGFARRTEPGHQNSGIEGDIDVFLPSTVHMLDILKVAVHCFRNPLDMVFLREDFAEIFLEGDLRAIQLIKKQPASVQYPNSSSEWFALNICNNFDYSYCRAAIFFDQCRMEYRWGSTPSFVFAHRTSTTFYALEQTLQPIIQRKEKACDLGFQIVNKFPHTSFVSKPAYAALQKFLHRWLKDPYREDSSAALVLSLPDFGPVQTACSSYVDVGRRSGVDTYTLGDSNIRVFKGTVRSYNQYQSRFPPTMQVFEDIDTIYGTYFYLSWDVLLLENTVSGEIINLSHFHPEISNILIGSEVFGSYRLKIQDHSQDGYDYVVEKFETIGPLLFRVKPNDDNSKLFTR